MGRLFSSYKSDTAYPIPSQFSATNWGREDSHKPCRVRGCGVLQANSQKSLLAPKAVLCEIQAHI